MKNLKFLLLLLTVSSCTTLKDPYFKEILDNAQHDIEVDSVKYFTTGLPFIGPHYIKSVDDTMSKKTLDNMEIIFDKIDLKQKFRKEIHNKYGLYERNLGCVIDKQISILKKKYEKITNPYLEKRNGKGWREKMKKEIDDINKN